MQYDDAVRWMASRRMWIEWLLLLVRRALMIQPSACANFQTSSRGVKRRPGRFEPPWTPIPVDPWGAFTPALNALAAHASKQGCGLALFASVETTFSSETVAALREQLVKHDALVVGAALPGHDFQEGGRPLGGRTAPWNTLALWRSVWESNFGRPTHRRRSARRRSIAKITTRADAGPALPRGLSAGRGRRARRRRRAGAEVATIRAAHALDPSRATAVLLEAPGVEWATRTLMIRRAPTGTRSTTGLAKKLRPAVHRW